jgi:hypothetical protein
MRVWIFVGIAFVGLAVLLAIREVRHSNQIQSFRRNNEELIIQQQNLTERLERAEEKSGRQPDEIPSGAGNSPTFTVSETPDLLARVMALENQVRALQAKINPEYDPTVASSDAEPDTNAPPKRNWGPEQALGPPDTERDADAVTAWTSLEPDAGPEWLAVGFERVVEAAQVRIRESYNPGAITKVTTLVNGAEVALWEGTSARGKAPRDFVVPVPKGIQANSIVVYQDTKRVSGWNEIDAVELVGRDGSRQWATSANASSSYADRTGTVQTLDFRSLLR